MFSIECHVGRLIEIRIWSPVVPKEASVWAEVHDRIVSAQRSKYVCFVDVVDATVFSAESADAYLAVMKSEPGLLRTGVLLNEDPVLSLQISRLIREAASDSRRTFRTVSPLRLWLSEVLDAAELLRLDTLVRQHKRALG